MSAPYYRMFPREWDDGTSCLTLEQEAALLRICNTINSRGQCIPDTEDSDREMMHRCRVSMRKWKALKAALLAAGKITIRDGKIYQARALSEIAYRAEIAENGAKGGRKRAENLSKTARKSAEKETRDNQNNGLSLANQNQNQNHTDTTLLDAREAEKPSREIGQLVAVRERITAAAGPGLADPAKAPGLITTAGEIARWLAQGCDLELDIIPVIQGRTAEPRGSPIASWKYFTAAIMDAHASRTAEYQPPENPNGKSSRHQGNRPGRHDSLADIAARLIASGEI